MARQNRIPEEALCARLTDPPQCCTARHHHYLLRKDCRTMCPTTNFEVSARWWVDLWSLRTRKPKKTWLRDWRTHQAFRHMKCGQHSSQSPRPHIAPPTLFIDHALPCEKVEQDSVPSLTLAIRKQGVSLEQARPKYFQGCRGSTHKFQQGAHSHRVQESRRASRLPFRCLLAITTSMALPVLGIHTNRMNDRLVVSKLLNI